MKNLLYLLISSVLIIACAQKKNEKASTIMLGNKPTLTTRQVATIATQLHLIAGANNTLLLADSSRTTSIAVYQQLMFRKYSTTSKQYNIAYNYYAQNTDTLTWIHDQIITQLSLLQANTSK